MFDFPFHIQKNCFQIIKMLSKKCFYHIGKKNFNEKKKSFEQVKSFETRLCIKIMGFFLEPQNFFPFKNKNP